MVDKYKEGLVILEKGKKAVYKDPNEFGSENHDMWWDQEIYEDYGNCGY